MNTWILSSALGRLMAALATAAAFAALLACDTASAARLKDVCEVQGARSNPLSGIGLIVGLGGTGDKTQAAIAAQERLLKRMDIDVVNIKDLKSDNTAVVIVTAELPAFAKEGTRLDVKVDSMYDCKSLEGGMLLETHLYGAGGGDVVYALAQGAVTVGGFTVSAGSGGSQKKNHTTSGRVPMGAHVEHEAPSTITDGERLVLSLKVPDFTTANNVQQAVNFSQTFGKASAMGAGSVHVLIPEAQRADLVNYIAQLQEVEVHSDSPTRIVINERTGTIVVGDRVIIKPCQVAHGNLTIKISTQPLVSQPNPLAAGTTVATQQTNIEVKEDEVPLIPIEGANAGEVAQSLNKLKVTPRDMISIFQALREAGALESDIEVM
jgi:flagellar P-ring protein precursor FlgI